MTDLTKKELMIFAAGALVALPVFGGLGLAVLGVVTW